MKPTDTKTVDNIIYELPRGYNLFTGKDIYREGDIVELMNEDQVKKVGGRVSWVVLSGASTLVRGKKENKHEVPVWRKKK